ncbi:hypothetical protein BRADI_2g09475v3 [Brachypodium distachyon]|uniref:Uncharacterized protein n=1 Tax=Brachypodium distachyon TaxID=15368 RepID=A0A2K2D7R5_BRADI|nr:hypothetical protein BRADI_2g09475v3 [Brachypodium distachyon]
MALCLCTFLQCWHPCSDMCMCKSSGMLLPIYANWLSLFPSMQIGVHSICANGYF